MCLRIASALHRCLRLRPPVPPSSSPIRRHQSTTKMPLRLPFGPSLAVNKHCAQLTEDEASALAEMRKILAPLNECEYKGQAGRIGVVGGSPDYCGAPYFAAMAALRTGADLVHVFCHSAAAPIIKGYSPDLIVHGILDREDCVAEARKWFPRLHMLVMGPGLGRDPVILGRVADLIDECRQLSKPLVLDADCLHLLHERPELVADYKSGCIVTPNGGEQMLVRKLPGVTQLLKGRPDLCCWAGEEEFVQLLDGGTGRRCGGQGDLLAGALAMFYLWAKRVDWVEPVGHGREVVACRAACFLIRKCNERAYEQQGRGALASDMLAVLPQVYKDFFEFTLRPGKEVVKENMFEKNKA